MEKPKGNNPKSGQPGQDKTKKVFSKPFLADKKNVKTNSVTNPDLPVFDFVDGVIEAGRFQENKEKLANYIGQHYGELQTIIAEGRDHTFEIPQADPNVLGDNDPYGINQRKLNAQIDACVRQESKYNSDRPKVFFVIWAQTSVSLQRKFREDANFQTWKTNCDPVSLWAQITNLSLNGGTAQVDRDIDYCEILARFGKVTQYANETVDDFYDRFQGSLLALEHGGITVWELVPQSIKTQVAHETADLNAIAEGNDDDSTIAELMNEELIQKATEKHLASLFLTKLAPRFSNLRRELKEGFKRGRDEYPTTLTRAYEMAAQHPDARGIQQNRPPMTHDAAGVVFVANGSKGSGKVGQEKGNEPKPSTTTDKNNDNSGDVTCYFCEKKGHIRKDCPKLKEAAKILRNNQKKEGTAAVTTHKYSWAFTTYKPFQQLMEDSSSDEEQCNHNLPQYEGQDSVQLEENDVLLDNEASISVFRDASLLHNIRDATVPAEITGVGGALMVNKVGDFGTFGEVYYDPRSIANIWCFSTYKPCMKSNIKPLKIISLLRITLEAQYCSNLGVSYTFTTQRKMDMYHKSLPSSTQ